MRPSLTPIALLVALGMPLAAQQPAKPDTARKEAPKISDNSFLMEEAYNQEAGVIQHISTFQRTREGNWAYSFTQEWPAPSQTHQLSYTVPVLRPDPLIGTGVGDIAINYRFQALGKDEELLWFSPRVSLYLPTGDYKNGRGAGGPGVEVMLPMSYALSDVLVTHWNAAALFTNAQTAAGLTGVTRGVRAGASVIWLASPNINLMLESVVGRGEALDAAGKRESENTFVVSPGIRGAFNFASGLQIVPGFAVPLGIGPSSGQRDMFFYLSFEHPIH